MRENTNDQTRKRVVIVGAGVSGLSAAFTLKQLTDAEIIVLEASDRPGGVISTLRKEDLTLELGPDSLNTQKPTALVLAAKLGLGNELIPTKIDNRRTFVAWERKLHPVPDGFVLLAPTNWKSFLTASLFSLKGKLRVALETIIPKGSGQDESLASFVRRRFGAETLDRVAQPLFTSIYGADPNELSIKAVMRRFFDLEQRNGSIILGLLKQKATNDTNAAGARYGLFVSLKQGLEQLIGALVSSLPKNTIRFRQQVKQITYVGKKYLIELENSVLESDAIIIAASAQEAGRILANLDCPLASTLQKIKYAPNAVVNFVYKKADFPSLLKGFGFLVPKKEKRSLLACTISSNKFANRVPEDKVSIRGFMGGEKYQGLMHLADSALIARASQDLKLYLGLSSDPEFTYLSRYSASIPKYEVDHLTLVSEIDKAAKRHKRLAIAGNYLQGPGIPDCIATAEIAAESIANDLEID